MIETPQAMTLLPQLDTRVDTGQKIVELEVPQVEISRPSSPTSGGPDSFTESSTFSKSTKSSSRESSPASSLPSSHPSSHPPKQAMKNGRPRTDFWQGYAFPSQILSPRPYEQIYAEIGYLTGSLQVEAYNTAKLIGHYSLVQDALKGEAAVGKHRRKLRKQLSSLKCRISQASIQERTIIVRLSELHMEAQSRNTWSQVQLRRLFAAESNPPSPEDKSPFAGPETPRSAQRPLNAACSEFIPSRNPSDSLYSPHPELQQAEPVDISLPQQNTADSEGGMCTPRMPGSECEREVPAERDDDGLQNRGLRYTYDPSERTNSSKGTSVEDDDVEHKLIRRRRPSMPNMRFIWPET